MSLYLPAGHGSDLPASQPASQPANQPTDMPGLCQPTNQPTDRPTDRHVQTFVWLLFEVEVLGFKWYPVLCPQFRIISGDQHSFSLMFAGVSACLSYRNRRYSKGAFYLAPEQVQCHDHTNLIMLHWFVIALVNYPGVEPAIGFCPAVFFKEPIFILHIKHKGRGLGLRAPRLS